ncbi:hypothetical protein PDESU_06005 [Pontiella desulfatans]|uniref:Polysaccharide chain length determinant N-terminal domain-containing protein n=1 Tax=Pontiella desulfatans TaxID=2750659 RepID=A0A6C2UBU4_PONDE|nr:lipopolysaccharide biosynthesis protein [Pontiella desulfatans]VGO17409.1 hypothetical protein PDESU_06005 [Pontiella desulfatans]
MTEKENTTEMPAAKRPREKRRRWLRLSFVLCVVLPTILGTLYFTLVASDKYVAGAGFSVRSMKPDGRVDIVGAFTGLAGGGSASSDSYIVLRYLTSRDLLERLENDYDFRSAYGSREIDFLSRLDPDEEIEKILEYWERMIHASYDPTSGIIDFKVRAFTAEDSLRVSELMLGYVRELVNGLSERARADVVRYTETEVTRMETRLGDALKAISDFRERGALDPAASAMTQIELLAGMEKQLLEFRVRIAVLEESVGAEAPSLVTLRRQADALEKQILDKSGGLNVMGSEAGLSSLLAEYEELQVEKTFAQKAYASALAALESARIEAGRQQRYLAVYQTPALPEFPLYPRRILYSVLLGAILGVTWGIGTLIVYSVRDHLS